MWSLVGTLLLSTSMQLASHHDLATVPMSLLTFAPEATLAALSPDTDPLAEAATAELLASLQRAGYPLNAQGVWIQSNNGVLLASRHALEPLPAASLTKLATTLAVLSAWAPDRRFTTEIGTNGAIANGTLQGDLIVVGGGDPFFVWEEAIVLGNALERLGIRRVTGDLVVSGSFAMNFEADGQKSANFLRLALHEALWTPEILTQYRTLPFAIRPPRISIEGEARYASTPLAPSTLLVRHRSLPLWQLLKRANMFSNNFMMEALAASLGGPAAVMRQAIEVAQIPPQEIQLVNGSGLGQENRISPRAVVGLLIALHRVAQQHGLTLADLLPAGACNCGTIEGRAIPPLALVKTGTLDDVSALAGVVPTRDRGPVWFAIINRGAGDIALFHRGQESVLQRLAAAWGRPAAFALSRFAPTPWQDTNRDELAIAPVPAPPVENTPTQVPAKG